MTPPKKRARRASGELSRSRMRERCKTAEEMVRLYGYATEEELAEYRPGGPSSAGGPADTFAWVYYWCQLGRFMGREELREQEQAVDVAALDAKLCDALSNTPLAVPLVPLGIGRERVVLHVFPKSLYALLNMRARDVLLRRLGQVLATLEDDTKTDPATQAHFLERVLAEIGYQYQLLAWTATHSEPGLPFDVEDDTPRPPKLIQDLDTLDFVRIARASAEVNAGRLAGVRPLTDPDTAQDSETGTRPTWAGFIASLADAQKVDETTLIKDRSLVSLVAGAQLRVQAQKAAEAAVKRRRSETAARDTTAALAGAEVE